MNKHFFGCLPLLFAMCLLSWAPLAHSTGYSFTTLNVPGAYDTGAIGINDSGQIVGYYDIREGGPKQGFLFSGGSYASLNVPGADHTFAYGINNAAQIVGLYYDRLGPGNSVVTHGFLWSGGSLTTLNVPGAYDTSAIGINDSGQIVGYYDTRDGGPKQGFLFSGGSYTSLNVPGADQTFAYGINNAGQIVGLYYDRLGPGNSVVTHGFLWSGGSLTTLNVPGAYDTSAIGINDTGQIVGYYDTRDGGPKQGFLFSGGSYTSLNAPGADHTFAYGIKNAGQIVGLYYDRLGPGNSVVTHGFITSTDRYYWRGIERPNSEKKYYDHNNPPIFPLRDFECKTHDYGVAGCGSPHQGIMPNVTFGAYLPESNSTYVTNNLSVKIAGIEICKNRETNIYAECSSEIGDRNSSLINLSQVMEAAERFDPNGMMDFAYGEATLDFSYEGNPQTMTFQFKAKIPKFEGLYIFQKDANGYWDWQKYESNLEGINFAYLLIHGWQSEKYPNFMWLYDLALQMKTQYPQLPVLGWFWQKESYGPGIPIKGGSLIGALSVSSQVEPQAEKLKRTLIDQHLNPAAKVHFIGHSFGGFMACLATRNLLQYRQDNQNIYDGINFKVTMLDTYHFVPSNITLKDAIYLLLSRKGEIENIFTEIGGELDYLSPDIKTPNTNLDMDMANHKLCGDHGAAPWHFFDEQLWKKPWLDRKPFPYVLPQRNIPAIHLLGID